MRETTGTKDNWEMMPPVGHRKKKDFGECKSRRRRTQRLKETNMNNLVDAETIARSYNVQRGERLRRKRRLKASPRAVLRGWVEALGRKWAWLQIWASFALGIKASKLAEPPEGNNLV